eukprot:gene5838-biopygen4840
MLPSSSADAVGDNSTPGPSCNQASSPSLTLGNMANFSRDGWFLPPQQWMSLPSLPAVSMMGGLPPVPGFLVGLIKQETFVDFTLLRLCSIENLPLTSTPNLQLDRLVKTLQPVCTFEDWAEAWAVFAFIVIKNATHKLPSSLAYFILIPKAHRDVPGSGWLAYDTAFRKQTANNPLISWATGDPTLYMATVLTSGVKKVGQVSARQLHMKPVLSGQRSQCRAWNFSSCKFAVQCIYAHCGGDNKARVCHSAKATALPGDDNRRCHRSPSSVSAIKKSRSK